ncbi:protein THEMIS2 [Neosynchiropus ocellatus]
MAGSTSLPLQQFIASLDKSCLPKILQVCSGVYFQGSVYEISGSEVCFSTGDLFKVTDLELLSVSCEDISNSETFELPINHKGLFKVVPDDMAYRSVEEMVKMRPVSLCSSLPFTFTSHTKLSLDNLTVGAGRALTVIILESREGEEDHLRCHLQGAHEAAAEVRLPLSTRGEFYVCEGQECFTLEEIMSSPYLRSQKFRFINTTMCDRPLILSPIYQIHAIMNMRKEILRFPSSLEMEVIDITDTSKDLNFEVPLSLTDMWSQPDDCFPAVVKIVDDPCQCPSIKSTWFPLLKKSQRMVFHEKGVSPMVLLSSQKSRRTKQYFLVSQNYGGRFRVRPREFRSVYEVYAASLQVTALRVSVTSDHEGDEDEGLPDLSVGDELEVVGCKTVQKALGKDPAATHSVEVLVFKRFQRDDHDDDDDDDDEPKDQTEEVHLPLFMRAHFVETQRDNKKYSLKDLSKKYKSTPIDLKVVTRDPKLKEDPLTVGSFYRIEGALLEHTIQASFLETLDYKFEIPVQRVSLYSSFTKLPLPTPADGPLECHLDTVTELTEAFFFELNRQSSPEAPPPPRPPKRATQKRPSTKKKSLRVNKRKESLSPPTPEIQDLTITPKEIPQVPEKIQPPVPRRASKAQIEKARPNMYVRRVDSMVKPVPPPPPAADAEDSDHNYETVDEIYEEDTKKKSVVLC